MQQASIVWQALLRVQHVLQARKSTSLKAVVIYALQEHIHPLRHQAVHHAQAVQQALLDLRVALLVAEVHMRKLIEVHA